MSEKMPTVSDKSLLIISALCSAAGFLIGYGESGEMQRAALYAGYGLIGPFVLLVFLALVGNG